MNTQYEFHMGEALDIFNALKVEQVSCQVLNADLGAMGATEVAIWSTKIGVTLEMQSSMGGCTLIVRDPRLGTQDRVLRSSVPDDYKGCTSPVGAVQNYIADLEQALTAAEPKHIDLYVDHLSTKDDAGLSYSRLFDGTPLQPYPYAQQQPRREGLFISVSGNTVNTQFSPADKSGCLWGEFSEGEFLTSEGPVGCRTVEVISSGNGSYKTEARLEFEEWAQANNEQATSLNYSTERYDAADTQAAWEAWQAGRNSRVAGSQNNAMFRMNDATIICGKDGLLGVNPITITTKGLIVNLDGYTLYAPGTEPKEIELPDPRSSLESFMLTQADDEACFEGPYHSSHKNVALFYWSAAIDVVKKLAQENDHGN